MSLSVVEQRALSISNEVLAPVGQKSGFFRGTGASLQDIWGHRELLGLLIQRELKARYKDSSLGILWSLFKPLVSLAIYYFAIGQILGAARSVPDFGIFVFIGLTMWGLFTEIIGTATSSVLANSGLVKKVYLPREIFPLAAVGGSLFNFMVQCVVLAGAIIFLSTSALGGTDLWLVPLSVITLIVFSTALGLLLSALNVYFRDVQHFVEIGIMVLFWASPIVYSFTFVHKALHGNWLEQLYLANPVTLAVVGMQQALWAAGDTATGVQAQVWPADLELRLVVALVVSTVLLWIAQRVFSRLQGNFAQEL